MKLEGKKALITGGNSGIGLATARLFIAEGAQVAITGRNQETLDAAAKELGPKAIAFRADVADAADRERVFKGIGDKFGTLDIVFANAGIAGPTPVGGADEKLFEQILRVNVTGVFFTIQSALPFLHEGASIILNGSVVATLGPPVSNAYVASKGAVRSMSRSLASELAPKGIRINVVVPGVVVTPIYGRSVKDQTPDLAALADKRFGKIVPLGRLGQAEEIAKAVLFLASSDSSYVHGAELVVDGGAAGAPLGAMAYRS
jgi:NAD(P)-dependent dehydrogenase (short-subunit alcohol dehydrogenase family)